MRGRERNKTAGTRVRRSARSREFSRQQGWYQPRQTELGKRRIGQRNHDRGGYNWKIYNQATPLYFTNFPDDWSYGDMWRTFAKYGRVYDIYSPTKKDKNGKRFGFVRFLEVKNEAELEHQLGQIRIGVQKLRVNRPKYSMKNNSNSIVEPKNTSEGNIRRSYADVVRNTRPSTLRIKEDEKAKGRSLEF
ncbi:hypothetical protein SLEP1_g56430 [Rubroshorea leprosula]|uniref:RRM domain-containing protein n=1 Tax=Rubroshorea leprosula TaxID=152421 RepID=A0AAV5MKM9_9ROSI|nr:hypothetical protein SLEP1_g56430 [Rubroshorea leprosula]